MRYTKALLYLSLFYVLPLAGTPSALLDVRIPILMGFCLLIVLSQPEMSIADASARRSTDGFSVLAILLAAGLTQVGAVVEWAHVHSVPAIDSRSAVSGGLLLFLGTAIRLWAIATLGRSFTATVQCREDQTVITTGPFRWVRHPSYLGAYLGVVGSALLLQAPLSLLAGGTLMGLAYAYRISLEEKTLVRDLPGYEGYRARTARIVPLIW